MSNQTALEYLIKLNADGAISSVKEFQQALDNAKKMASQTHTEVKILGQSFGSVATAIAPMVIGFTSLASAVKLGFDTTQELKSEQKIHES